MGNWVEVCSLSDFDESNKKVVKVYNDLEVLLIKLKDVVFAVENRCSHDEKPLDDGRLLDDSIIECAHHGAQFDLSSGKALKMPAVTPVNVFKTKIQQNKVFVFVE